MIIKSTDLAFASRQAFFRHHTENENPRIWEGHRKPNAQNTSIEAGKTISGIEAANAINTPFKVSLSDEALKKRTGIDSDAPNHMQSAQATDNLPDEKWDSKALLIKSMVEMFTGKKISAVNFSNVETQTQRTQELMREQSITQSAPGMEYQYHEVYHESEQLNFSASGTIQTTDGQTFNFNLDLQISRDFYQETNVQLATGSGTIQKDPLILNFDGLASELSNMIFDFELDIDGKKDKRHMPAMGRGFLSIDKNKNDAQNSSNYSI